MSKPTPPKKGLDQGADELFDNDRPSASDDDFLAELDRVLAGGSSPPASAPRPPPAATPPEGAPDLAGLKRKIDAFADSSDPDATVRLEPEPRPTYGRRGEPPESAPTPKPAPTRQATQPPGQAAQSGPTARSAPVVETAEGPPDRHRARPRAQPAKTGAASPEPSRVQSGSGILGGISLLLGLAGTALGGGALWLAMERPAPAVPVTAPDPLGAQIQRRLTELEQRLEVLRQQFKDRGDQTQKRIGHLEGQVDQLAAQAQAAPAQAAETGQDEKLQAQMAEVHAHLAQVQEQLAALAQRPAVAAPPAPKKPPAPRPKTASASRPKGAWAVNLESFARPSVAAREQAKLKAKGLETALVEVRIKGRRWYRLYIPGFASRRAARAALPRLKEKYGLNSAWVGKAPGH